MRAAARWGPPTTTKGRHRNRHAIQKKRQTREQSINQSIRKAREETGSRQSAAPRRAHDKVAARREDLHLRHARLHADQVGVGRRKLGQHRGRRACGRRVGAGERDERGDQRRRLRGGPGGRHRGAGRVGGGLSAAGEPQRKRARPPVAARGVGCARARGGGTQAYAPCRGGAVGQTSDPVLDKPWQAPAYVLTMTMMVTVAVEFSRLMPSVILRVQQQGVVPAGSPVPPVGAACTAGPLCRARCSRGRLFKHPCARARAPQSEAAAAAAPALLRQCAACALIPQLPASSRAPFPATPRKQAARPRTCTGR